ncbi:MAG TPA: hypothetical protein VNU64_18900 [Burkholderiales bacterium]|nr:hypothetical protein [Burkholderiales bacterium]
MRIHVRSIAAQCVKCGGEDWYPSDGKRAVFGSHTTMRCAGCNATTTYVELIMQIAEKAVAASAATLAEVRRRRGK